MADADRASLVDAVHRVLVDRGFWRASIYGLRAARADDPDERLDGIAAWNRWTEADSEQNTMNGASVYGNGLVRVFIEKHQIEFLAGAIPAQLAAELVERFVDRMDAELGVIVEPR